MKTRLIGLLLGASMILGSGTSVLASTEHTIRWLDEDIVPVGNTKMESYYMPRFSEGLLAVESEGTGFCGFVNFFGDYIIEPTYLDVLPFSEGVAAVKTRVLLSEVEERLTEITLWQEEFLEESQEGVEDLENGEETDSQLEEAAAFFQSLSGSSSTFLKKERGEFLLARDHEKKESEKSLANGRESDLWVERYGYIDYSGNWLIEPTFETAFGFSEGLAAVELTEGNWGFVNHYGRLVFGGEYDWVHDFQDGYAIVQENGLYGLVDETGSFVIDLQFNSMGGGDGIYPVRMEDLYGLMDTSGTLVQTYRYDDMGFFQEELALVEVDGTWGYVDNLGALVIPADADQAFHFQDGYAWVIHQGYCYFIDSSGNTRLEMPYLSQMTSFYNGYSRGKKGNYYGFFDKTGTTRLDYIYRDAVPPSEGIGLVYDGVQWGLFYTQHRSSEWAKNYVAQAAEMEVIPSTFEGIDLSAPMTRGLFASLVVHMYELLVDESKIALDVKNDPYYYPSLLENHYTDTRDLWVRRAFHLSLAFGVSSTEFGMYEVITREQAATMLVTLYQRITGETLEPQGAPPFEDHDDISFWSQNSVYVLAEKGILTGVGDNYFAPHEPISGETALVMALAMCYEMNI